MYNVDDLNIDIVDSIYRYISDIIYQYNFLGTEIKKNIEQNVQKY